MEHPKLNVVADQFQIAKSTVKRYVHMSDSEIEKMDLPKDYKKHESPVNQWLNVIFKMMRDGHRNETIYFYLRDLPVFTGRKRRLETYIYLIGKNNFPRRPRFHLRYLMESVLPPEVICFSRAEILKYVVTCNPRTKRNQELGKYIDLIKEKYPVVGFVEEAFKEFHAIIMGDDPERLEGFLEKYEDGRLFSFCKGIRRDMTAVKNAIIYAESSGFVEGNNNKFKVIKRTVYGRSGLENLEKKCKLAFMAKKESFNLHSLI